LSLRQLSTRNRKCAVSENLGLNKLQSRAVHSDSHKARMNGVLPLATLTELQKDLEALGWSNGPETWSPPETDWASPVQYSKGDLQK
jgi:hypothetical protein